MERVIGKNTVKIDIFRAVFCEKMTKKQSRDFFYCVVAFFIFFWYNKTVIKGVNNMGIGE